MIRSIIFLGLALLLGACEEKPELISHVRTQEISGRDEGPLWLKRPVYRVQLPSHWQYIESRGSLADTTKPNAEFLAYGEVHITFHSFPSRSLEERIPPSSQVARWKSQEMGAVKPFSNGGFIGLFLEGKSLMAWSLQLDASLYQKLRFLASSAEEQEHYKQLSADYTIKITGPPELILAHKNEFLDFAKSCELIQAIPERL